LAIAGASVEVDSASGNPPTLMYCGTDVAPRQSGDATPPSPGQLWQDEQSCVPASALKPLWSNEKPAAGFTFMWQLLHRAEVRLMTRGAAVVKFLWKLACAHSLPAAALPAVATPTWVWQKLQF